MSGTTLEGGIGLTVIPYAINDFRALKIFLNHIVNRIRIILQISVHGNHSVNFRIACLHQTCEQSVLVSPIMSQFHSME